LKTTFRKFQNTAILKVATQLTSLPQLLQCQQVMFRTIKQFNFKPFHLHAGDEAVEVEVSLVDVDSVGMSQVQKHVQVRQLVSLFVVRTSSAEYCDPPSVGRRREQDIIRHAPGITALARGVNNPMEAFQFFVTNEMVDNIIIQTTEKPDVGLEPGMKATQHSFAVTGNRWIPRKSRLLLDCALAGVYRSHRKPVSTLWSERQGRPVFTATMSRRRFTDILKYCRFDDKGTLAERQSTDKLAPFRDINYVSSIIYPETICVLMSSWWHSAGDAD